jgi:DNA-binding transcriptional regulator YhcF (GntR family)
MRQGMATAKRGEGTFVIDDRQALIRLHEDMRQSLLEDCLTEMRRLGYSSEEILTSLQAFIQTGAQTTTDTQSE